VSGRLLVAAWLAFVWVALWGDPSAANIVVGVLVGTVAVIAFPVRPFGVACRPVALARLGAAFVADLVVSSLEVAWEVVTPRRRIREGIVAVPIHGTSRVISMLVANMVSLTPGTLTVAVSADGRVLYVHVLHLRDPAQTRRSVQALERRAVRAFGSPDALARLGEPLPVVERGR